MSPLLFNIDIRTHSEKINGKCAKNNIENNQQRWLQTK